MLICINFIRVEFSNICRRWLLFSKVVGIKPGAFWVPHRCAATSTDSVLLLWVHACHVWRSEDNFQESDLSSRSPRPVSFQVIFCLGFPSRPRSTRIRNACLPHLDFFSWVSWIKLRQVLRLVQWVLFPMEPSCQPLMPELASFSGLLVLYAAYRR